MPHAGETTGPETVWDSLRLLGAERIGHGVSAAQDPELLAHLADTGVVLEVCPTSNIATRAVERIEEHPLRTFVEAGVTVTINSDDPPMFATTLNHDYEVAAGLLDLDERGVADLARAAVDGVVRARRGQGTRRGRDRGVRRATALTLPGEVFGPATSYVAGPALILTRHRPAIREAASRVARLGSGKVPPAGLEPATNGLEGRCAIHCATGAGQRPVFQRDGTDDDPAGRATG